MQKQNSISFTRREKVLSVALGVSLIFSGVFSYQSISNFLEERSIDKSNKEFAQMNFDKTFKDFKHGEFPPFLVTEDGDSNMYNDVDIILSNSDMNGYRLSYEGMEFGLGYVEWQDGKLHDNNECYGDGGDGCISNSWEEILSKKSVIAMSASDEDIYSSASGNLTSFSVGIEGVNPTVKDMVEADAVIAIADRPFSGKEKSDLQAAHAQGANLLISNPYLAEKDFPAIVGGTLDDDKKEKFGEAKAEYIIPIAGEGDILLRKSGEIYPQISLSPNYSPNFWRTEFDPTTSCVTKVADGAFSMLDGSIEILDPEKRIKCHEMIVLPKSGNAGKVVYLKNESNPQISQNLIDDAMKYLTYDS